VICRRGGASGPFVARIAWMPPWRRPRLAAQRHGPYISRGREKRTDVARFVEALMDKFPKRTIAIALAILSLLGASLRAGAQPSAPMSGQTLAAAHAVILAGETTRVSLAAGADAVALRRKLADAARQRAVYLVLDDLKAAEAPSVVYEIYLGLPAGAAPSADDPHFVGTLNFFAVAPPNTVRRSRSYDVTSLVSSLPSQGGSDDNLAVTIVGRPQPGQASSAPPGIGSVALVAQ
jgi:hypothetical protein